MKQLKITLNLDNNYLSFSDGEVDTERVADELRYIADRIDDGVRSGAVMSSEGDIIGNFEM